MSQGWTKSWRSVWSSEAVVQRNHCRINGFWRTSSLGPAPSSSQWGQRGAESVSSAPLDQTISSYGSMVLVQLHGKTSLHVQKAAREPVEPNVTAGEALVAEVEGTGRPRKSA